MDVLDHSAHAVPQSLVLPAQSLIIRIIIVLLSYPAAADFRHRNLAL